MDRPITGFDRLYWSAYTAYLRRRQDGYAFRPLAAIQRDRDRRVRRAVTYAYRWVPYYRETMGRLGLRPSDFKTADDLAKLPLLRREQLQRDPEYFVSQQRPLGHYLRRHNSGSTGTPCVFYNDISALCQYAAYNGRARAPFGPILGRGYGYRKTSILRRVRGDPSTPRKFYLRLLLVPRRVAPRRQDLSLLEPPEVNVTLINEFRPHVLESSGAYLASLFGYLQASGREMHQPKVLCYTLDGMPESARQMITEQYGIPIFSSYEANEATCLAFECEQHQGHHVNIDISPVRIVDDEGHTLPAGESGNVVVSNLILRGTMMLNYMLQDVAAWQPGGCACGRTLPLLGRLVGRLDDWIVLPSGRKVHPHVIPGIMLREEGIWQYQVSQESPSQMRAAVVPSERVDRQVMRQRLLTRFAEALGDEVQVDVVFVDDVERTARGKVRPVISLQTRGWLDGAGDNSLGS